MKIKIPWPHTKYQQTFIGMGSNRLFVSIRHHKALNLMMGKPRFADIVKPHKKSDTSHKDKACSHIRKMHLWNTIVDYCEQACDFTLYSPQSNLKLPRVCSDINGLVVCTPLFQGLGKMSRFAPLVVYKASPKTVQMINPENKIDNESLKFPLAAWIKFSLV